MPRPRTLPDTAILAATARRIAQDGIAALTLAKVAEDVGLSPATLVQRFGSKRGLLVALGADAAERAGEPFARGTEAGLAPLDALVTGLTAQVEEIGSVAELANHVGFLQLDLTDDDLYAHASSHHRGTRRAIEQLLAEAATAGQLADTTDRVRLARDLHLVYQGVLITWALDEAAEPAARPLAEVVRIELQRTLSPYRKVSS